MIPKIIWQTYKDPYDTLADYMIDAINTWKDLNPDYDYRYMDDDQATEFVKNEYGQEWYDIFINVPVGVMRGDLWRYLITYKYGGIYADLDTLCQVPISNWILEDKDFIVCPENERDFCQWTFAVSAGHPFLKSVLDHIKEGFKNPDYTQQHFVHIYTGPYAWTNGILKALEVRDDMNINNIVDDFEIINSLPKAIENKFHLYGGEKWRIFHFYDVIHIYGSQRWKQDSYVRWIEHGLIRGGN